MNILRVYGKFLDQPKLVNKFKKAVPAILLAGGGIYGVKHVLEDPPEFRKNEAKRTAIVMAATIASALVAPKITEKIIKSEAHHHHGHCHGNCHGHAHHAEALIEKFVQRPKGLSAGAKEIIDKAEEGIISPKDIKKLFEEVEPMKGGKEFLSGEHGLIPDPEEIDFNHILKEDIPKYSVLGLIPVLGGMAGGIIGDKLTTPYWKDKIADKVKEGSYQYLANIFLCNVGAGAALYAFERAGIKNKAARAAGMVGGIMLTGVVFGSAVANFIGEKIINPLIGATHNSKALYSERVPEALDIGLHVDDIATVAALSGLKWIVPALPILYSVSGYRTGIGYRNKE